MTNQDAAWLAGLLEGEGCFQGRARKTRTTCRPAAIVYLQMNDLDVVERACRLMQAPSVRSRPVSYQIGSNGAQAEAVMWRIRPFMGERRGAKIDSILAMDLSHRPRGSAIPEAVGHCTVEDSDEWLAGLLEGEGYFAGALKSGRRPYAKVALKMTDRDIVERAAALMNAPSVNEYDDLRPNCSPTHNTGVGAIKAEKVMRRIRPFMGARRGAKIDSILAMELSHHPRTPRLPTCL